jgi:hypothetical protein
VHRRSHRSLLRRQVQHLIFSFSYHDYDSGDFVNRVSREQILGLIDKAVQISAIPDIEKGEVLVDSRGNGTFQRERQLLGQGRNS